MGTSKKLPDALRRCLVALVDGPLHIGTLAESMGVDSSEAKEAASKLATAALVQRMANDQWRLTGEGFKAAIEFAKDA
jgi:Mn-dependent DtxR family transcriptional regulator